MTTLPDLQEERLVAELAALGVRYLSRQTHLQVHRVRPPARFLADLVCQPTSRVRLAFIAALLAQPGLAAAVPAAAAHLKPGEQVILKLLFTAAVILQQKYAGRLREYQPAHWQCLPDLYSAELGVSSSLSPDERLRALGFIHRQLTGSKLNWVGTYENVAQTLLHRWEKERQWNL